MTFSFHDMDIFTQPLDRSVPAAQRIRELLGLGVAMNPMQMLPNVQRTNDFQLLMWFETQF
jgi:hypothetical protein